MYMKKKKIITVAVMVVLSVLLAYLQFVQARCNSDDAGTYICIVILNWEIKCLQ